MEPADPRAWSAIEIGLVVDQMDAMKRFYCEGLGFKPSGHVDLPSVQIEGFRFGDCLLKLALFRAQERRPQPRSDPACYLTLRVPALDDALGRVLGVGARLLVPISSVQTEASKTVRFAFVADPMGNRIELVEGDAWSA